MAARIPYSSSLTRGGGLPLTALIDVVFLVVIFFMVNASFAVDASRATVSAIGVDLPDTESVELATANATVITITRDGSLVLERGGEIYHVGGTSELAVLLAAEGPPASITVRGDVLIPYGQLVAIMDTARIAGIRNISLATDDVLPAGVP